VWQRQAVVFGGEQIRDRCACASNYFLLLLGKTLN
jgi:hypothetical protein